MASRILIKDNIETGDPLPTTAGSHALEHSARSVAPLTVRAGAAGAVILGRTNLSEWTNFLSTRAYGSPWHITVLVTLRGGSSRVIPGRLHQLVIRSTNGQETTRLNR